MTFIEFVSSPFLLIAGLTVITILQCWTIPKLRSLDKIFLKKFDYYWIALSALGIIGLTNKNAEFFEEVAYKENKFFAEIEFERVMNAIDSSKHCFKFSQSSSSPQNIESIQKIQDSMCSWAKYALQIAIKSKASNSKINLQEPLIEDQVIQQDLKIINRAITRYNQYAGESLGQTHSRELQNLSLLLQILSPLILVIGLSIRITKTYLEIKLEKYPK